MKQNPFSLYDFLGYVFPGALALMLIVFFNYLSSHLNPDTNPSLYSIFTEAIKFLKSQNKVGNLGIIEETVILTIAAYIMGHIVAYMSSLTVEKFSILVYGYPSEFLMLKVDPYKFLKINPENREATNIGNDNQNGVENSANTRPEKLNWWELTVEYAWRLIICLFLFPISLCTVLLGYVFRMNKFLIKPLDKILTSTISNNIEKLKESLGISPDDKGDFHRIIYHYEYEHQSNHITKLDNYVALYGFLRALTFIANCSTLWITIKYVIPTIKLEREPDCHLILLFIVCIGITYVFFMAFMKFYRRFTLEGLMCLVIDDSFKIIPKMAYEYTPSTPTAQSDSHTIDIASSDTRTVTGNHPEDISITAQANGSDEIQQ